MTSSRERVLEAAAHRPTDRAPADFHAIPVVTDGLIAKLGVADTEELLVALGVDMRRIGNSSVTRKRRFRTSICSGVAVER